VGAADLPDRRRQRPRSISAAPDHTWVTWSRADHCALPIVCRPVTGVRLAEWGAACAGLIDNALLAHAAILFRGFLVEDVDAFATFAARVGGEPTDYTERTSPRTRVKGTVFTSTDYPAGETILLHSENSYANTWPLLMFFLCSIPPASGGATPLADCRNLLARLDECIVRRFRERGVCYLRNFSDHLGLSWQTSFQSTDRAQVEAYCHSAGIDVEWTSGDGLRTKAVRPAIARHPVTGEEVWFNQALLFHASCLPAVFRNGLGPDARDEDAPTHATYGDGSSIEPETIGALSDAYRAETVRFNWQRGDVLLLDNMRVAHGREAFQGPRTVLVSMKRPTSWADLRQ
jgi:alpha-ketoglutarate-dependent taurine dioxygenase